MPSALKLRNRRSNKYPNRPANCIDTIIAARPMSATAAEIDGLGPVTDPIGYEGTWWSDTTPLPNLERVTHPLLGVPRTRMYWKPFQDAGVGGDIHFGGWKNGSPGDSFGAVYIHFRNILLWGNDGTDYEQQATGTKWFYLDAGGNNTIFFILRGSGPTGTLVTSALVGWWQQGTTVGAQNHNSASGRIYVGQMHDLELYLEENTLASVFSRNPPTDTIFGGDGKLRVWIDGVLAITKDDICTRRTGFGVTHITEFNWDPVWGGTGGTRSDRYDYLWWDEIFIAGDPNLKS